MKKIFAFTSALILASVAFTQANNITNVNGDNIKQKTQDLNQTSKAAETKNEVLSLKETEYNFGKIPQGKPVTHVFTISNNSSSPLKLDNVQTSCGCTTPEWSRDEILPGASTNITVGFNAMSDGQFTKYITLTYNGKESKQLIIKGEVWKTPSSSAPENEALNFLKTQ